MTAPLPFLRSDLEPSQTSARTSRYMTPLEGRLESSSPYRDVPLNHLNRIRDQLVINEAKRRGVPVLLALAVSHGENARGIPWAVSPHRPDVGLMGISAQAHKMTPEALAEPRLNVQMGVGLLRRLFERHGSWESALRGYNGALGLPEAGDRYVDAVRLRMQMLAKTPGWLQPMTEGMPIADTRHRYETAIGVSNKEQQ